MPRKRATPRTLSEVIDAALLVVDEAGLDGLTLRGVAAVSGVPTMTLYAYFESKEQLVELMASAVTSRLFAVTKRATWQATLEELCFHVRATALAHPGWLSLFGRGERPPSFPIREHVRSLMLASGYSERVAGRAVLEASLMSLGLAQLQLSVLRGRTAPAPGVVQLSSRDLDWDGTFAATVARWIAGLDAEARPRALPAPPHAARASSTP
ncbi:MAG: regulatory protein TetR [Polyangiaceae bacterium]|jgi:AcrR family transcriptional regulator|nr:regulatory protein TetR [Polyangiaceae bacterium]